MKKAMIALLLATLFAFNACKPEQGDVGPQGPQGVAGAKGDKGPAGDKGAFSGIVSPWTEIKSADWKPWTVGPPNSFTYTIADKNITSSVLDKGLILAFYRVVSSDDGGHIIPLPDETANYVAEYQMSSANGGRIQFNVKFRNATVVNPNMEDWNIRVRWIVVPPASTARMAAINWQSYEEVKLALGLED